jgi:vacuolar-type H+-ATPase subunit E/Vma4
MGVDALIARMEQDAQARIAALRADADAEIAAIDAARAQAAANDQSRLLAARRAERMTACAVERAHARQASAARVLATEHAFVERVFTRAQSLAATARARLIEALPELFAAAIGHLGGQPAALRCPPALGDAVQRCVGDRPDVDLVIDDRLPEGFIAATRDGSCTIDCTLPALLAATRDRVQAALVAQVPR